MSDWFQEKGTLKVHLPGNEHASFPSPPVNRNFFPPHQAWSTDTEKPFHQHFRPETVPKTKVSPRQVWPAGWGRTPLSSLSEWISISGLSPSTLRFCWEGKITTLETVMLWILDTSLYFEASTLTIYLWKTLKLRFIFLNARLSLKTSGVLYLRTMS